MLAFQNSEMYVILMKCDRHNITFLWYSFYIIDKNAKIASNVKINCAVCPRARRVMAILRCR